MLLTNFIAKAIDHGFKDFAHLRLSSRRSLYNRISVMICWLQSGRDGLSGGMDRIRVLSFTSRSDQICLPTCVSTRKLNASQVECLASWMPSKQTTPSNGSGFQSLESSVNVTLSMAFYSFDATDYSTGLYFIKSSDFARFNLDPNWPSLKLKF